MPVPTSMPLILTTAQRTHLERVARTPTAPYRRVIQAKILLYSASGLSQGDIASRLDCEVYFIDTTQARFKAYGLDGLYNHPEPSYRHLGKPNAATVGVSPVGLYPFGVPPASVLFDFATTAEELGFSSLWLGDHLVFHAPVLESLTFLAALAARTDYLKLGTSVYLMPLRHPTLVAKVTSTLDVLSGGRLIFGVGIGGENPREFEANDTTVRDRAGRADESLEILKRLWTESNVSHRGRHYQLSEITLEPKPLQTPHPAIWVGARSNAGLQRAVRMGNGWVSVMVTPDRYRQGRQRITELAQQQGRSLDGFVFAHYAFIYVPDDLTVGRKVAVEFLSRLYNQPFDALIERLGIIGSAEVCVEKLQQFINAGVDYLILAPMCTPHEQVKQLEVYAQKILPHLHIPNVHVNT
jgi:probable F420-dependent oxidoreductase